MIELDHVVAGYGGQAVTPSLCGVVERGSMTAIVGANGCGKSTLLKTLAGLLVPVSGALRWPESRPVIGWLAQRQSLDPHFPVTVQDVVSMGSWPRVSLFRGLSSKERKQVPEALERVGIRALAGHTIDTLSGGQFQRMLFARMWLQQAPLVMLDEPFTGVDEATSQVLMEQIVDMHQHGQTILAVLHDSERVSRYFPQTLRLDGASARWGATPLPMQKEGQS
ncbi:ATP-binding cassette domain-containing protein [Yokenella regensburgei]|uniref:metal ABC transporter ATP-binding protein n=1 Tax=Yokenella regensburgei TaxID=158877 RepID=UPI003F191655